MERMIFRIEGMTCSHCERTIGRALKHPGIKKSSVSLADGKAYVEFDHGRITADSIKSLIENAGYKVSSVEK
jgi:copper chaperone